MRVVVLGIDGYIGWPLALHLADKGYEIAGVDNFIRRTRVKELGSNSITPILEPDERTTILSAIYPNHNFSYFSLGQHATACLSELFEVFSPDVIIHLAEQPSAAWSMASAAQAIETQKSNVLGTLELLWAMQESCPQAHLIKLGTMGEYGTPNCQIPEGIIPDKCIGNGDSLCLMGGLQFPRKAGSFYHLSKVHDTYNIEFACRNWGLHSTDIMQGVVFGLNNAIDPSLLTRFDYDECFGTVINRFCAQALVDHPLTIYGAGEQTRGYLPLQESIECITLAMLNPPKVGEYRVFNQFGYTYTVNELAIVTSLEAKKMGYRGSIARYANPRIEAETHVYHPVRDNLYNLGYRPSANLSRLIKKTLKTIEPYKDEIDSEVIVPRIHWDGHTEDVWFKEFV